MLAHFIIPHSLLDKLIPFEDLMDAQRPVMLSVLGSSTQNTSDFKKALTTWLTNIDDVHAMLGNKISTPSMELKLPASFKQHEVSGLLKDIRDTVKQKGNYPNTVFIEVTQQKNWRAKARYVIEALSESETEDALKLGFKLRTGGIEPWMVPDITDVAWTLKTTAEAGISIKFTAGLHHPVRNYDAEVGSTMYGFFNIFTAGLAAHIYQPSTDDLINILEERNPASFQFSNSALSWKDYHVTIREIEQIRGSGLISFGSCSFEEPLEDLKTLKLI